MSTVVPVVAFAALAVSWLVADETPTPQEPLSKVLYSHFPRNFCPEGGTSPPFTFTHPRGLIFVMAWYRLPKRLSSSSSVPLNILPSRVHLHKSKLARPSLP